MTNFMKLNARNEMRLGEYAMRLLQVEAHIRRGELRAATARIAGMAEELDAFRHQIGFPAEMVLIGTQLGLLSGRGPLLRGRLPGVVLGGLAGWFVGQSLTAKHRRYLDEIRDRVALINRGLAGEFPAGFQDEMAKHDITTKEEQTAPASGE